MAHPYSSLHDEKLIRLALYEAADLTASGQAALRTEIQRRSLGSEIELGFEWLRQGITQESLELLKHVVISQPCPVCGSTDMPLEAAEIRETASIWLLTHTRIWLKIGCSSCLNRMMRHALRKTLLLGWWSLPDGIIQTAQTLRRYLLPPRFRRAGRAQALQQFVIRHAGYLYAYRYQESQILKLLQHQNTVWAG